MKRSTNGGSGANERRFGGRLRPLGLGIAFVLTLLLASGAAAGQASTDAVGPPQVVKAPSIDGVASEGQLLRADTGRWRPHTVRRATYAFQWQLCDVSAANCAPVAGATDSIYAVRHGDVGHTLTVVVTATTQDGGSTHATSTATDVVVPAETGAPAIAVRPAIVGTPVVGGRLFTRGGTWVGTQPISLRIHWRSCPVGGGPCRDLRRFGETYVVRRGDAGRELRVLVTASNAVLTGNALSDATQLVGPVPPAPVAPQNAAAPSLAGTARLGETLTATSGSWTGTPPIRFVYRWLRCGASGGSPNGSGCATIPRAVGAAYRLTRSDVGTRLRVRVTASNQAGAASAVSSPSATVVAQAAPASPRDVREPLLTGNAIQGQTLTTSLGDWAGAQPISYSYQWVRCGPDGGRPDGSNCAVIPGATTEKYVLAAGDVGKRIRSRIIARNAGGQQTAASNATATVEPLASGPPRETREPSISGTVVQGGVLAATSGSWAGAKPITLSYQWVRCGTDGGRPDGSNCAAIPGATTTRYALTAGDVGSRLRVRVTGRNARGTATVASNATTQIAGAEPTLPAGAVRLPNGRYSIPVTSVSLPARLMIDGVSFRPNPVRTRRTTLALRVHVVDTRGFVVRDALVFGRSTPLVTSAAGEQRTAMDGWAVLRMVPRATFPIRTGHSVQFFLRVRKPGGNLLAGVTSRRLVQVRTAG